MVGRAQGYSDYYKNNDQTPDGSNDEHDYRDLSVTVSMGKLSPSDRRKAAIRRRMMKNKKPQMGSQMGQPNPPGDLPLIEGLDTSWNEIVNYIPEDKRTEFGPKLKERVTSLTSDYEPLKQWEDLQKSGITPEDAGNALSILTTIENNPQQVYETLGKYLESQGLTPKQAKEAVEGMQEGETSEDPRIAYLQQQIETMAQILLAQRDQTSQARLAQEADAEIDKQLKGLEKKYGKGSFDENEILMRMAYNDMDAEQAYQDYTGFVTKVRTSRPAPMLLGSGGHIPTNTAPDVRKMDSKQTKDFVAQIMQNAVNEGRQASCGQHATTQLLQSDFLDFC